MFETLVVPSFGGGLDFRTHPGSIRDDQWSWSSGYLARDGVAEVGPSYTLFASVGSGATEVITGMFQNPFTFDGAIVATVDSGSVCKLYTVTGVGTVTNIPIVGTAGLRGLDRAQAQAGLLNGFLVINFGSAGGVGATVSLVRYDGTTATAIPLPTLLIQGNHLVSFGGHLILAGGAIGAPAAAFAISAITDRTVAWSASYNPVATPQPQDTWDPTVGNDADNIILDDADSGILGMVVVADDRCVLLTRHALHTLTPTGALPAFTRRTFFRSIGPFGMQPSATFKQGGMAFYGDSPLGCVFASGDDFYLTTGGGPRPIGGAVFRYWKENLTPSNVMPTRDGTNVIGYGRPIFWHDHFGLVVVPRPVSSGLLAEGLCYDPKGEAWSRIPWVSSGAADLVLRHAFIESFSASLANNRRHWFASHAEGSLAHIYVEDLTVPLTGSFVETKDFAFSEPTADDYVDRIKVDWESTVGTDVLQVDVASRPDLNLSQVGPYGLEINNPAFTSLGTLTAGQSELPVRVRGKYIRFRFSNTTGGPRIRGLSIRRERGGDRKT